MAQRVLVTGGAGFIGSHLCDELLEHGYDVRVLDAFNAQVHGDAARVDLDPSVEVVAGDVCDREAVAHALQGCDAVVHLAARVGVGQSMYDIVDYTSANDVGAATVLEAVTRNPVGRLVVASSMSVYGEGLARREDGASAVPRPRAIDRLRAGDWELRDDRGRRLEPVPTPETKPPDLSSIYALNKFAQERMFLIAGAAYRIPTVALRLFNVYGPRQALSNPYTGVLAIFAARLLNKRAPLIFEDGLQQRDFVHVKDVARAFRLAIESDAADGRTINIGSGRSRTVRSVAHDLARALGCAEISPEITGRFRAGDIRHCFADVALARDLLGFEAKTNWDEGIDELVRWLAGQVATDRVGEATAELDRRGLVT